MRGSIELAETLDRINGRGFKAYHEVEGAWTFNDFELHIDRVQAGPFASPSRMRVRVTREAAHILPGLLASPVRRVASASFLARRFRRAIRDVATDRTGSGKSGLVTIDAGGQEVLERTAVLIGDDFIEARIEVGLPAGGRRVLGRAAARLLVETLPRVVDRAWLDRCTETDGASGLLLDEDTSATNFMVRDARMQALVHPSDEPITPFIERVREIYEVFGVSTLLVMGGAGEFFRVADAVIEMKNYRARDVTQRAKALIGLPTDASDPTSPAFRSSRKALVAPETRIPDPASFDSRRGRSDVKWSSRAREEIVFGTTEIDLRGVEQLFDASQTRAVAGALHLAATRFMKSDRSLSQVLDEIEALFDSEGLDVLDPYQHRHPKRDQYQHEPGKGSGRHPGAFARPRRFEIAAAINRMRTLRVRRLSASKSGA